MDKRKGGTKVQRTEACFFEKKIQVVKKKMDKEKPLGGLSAKRNDGIISLTINEGYFTS